MPYELLISMIQVTIVAFIYSVYCIMIPFMIFIFHNADSINVFVVCGEQWSCLLQLVGFTQ